MFRNCTLLRYTRKVQAKPLLRLFHAVLAPSFAAILHAHGVKLAAHYRIAQVHILHAPAAHEDYRVLLQSVPNPRNVGGNFHTVREPNARDFADGGVRLARRFGCYLGAHAALEWRIKKHRLVPEHIEAFGKRGRFVLANALFPPAPNKLVYRGHRQNIIHCEIKCKLLLAYAPIPVKMRKRNPTTGARNCHKKKMNASKIKSE
ncbi:MAG: hypothetical protein UX81_C0019G0005 [Parcubacteria group bacterium GW2011_GWA2_47_12]|nr:MAG: hypothetical protein UX81_C0019G0005 [Parcubacteria group bacterium GW2011_GWA2_47_12]